MAGGKYTIFLTVDAAGAVTGLREVGGALGTVQTKAKETGAAVAGAFKFLATAEIIHQLYSITDAFLSVKSSIQVAGTQGKATYDVFDKLIDVANATRSPVERLSELYRNLGLYSKTLGLNQKDLISITKTVGESMALMGGTTTRAQNGIIQLAKALEEGKIQGQTFNALLKDFSPLMQNLAQAAGVSVIQLKAMAKSGELSSAELAKLLLKAAPITDGQFGRSVVTLSQAFTVLKNNLIGAVADMDRMTSIFSVFAGLIVSFANHMRQIAPILVSMGVALLSLRLIMSVYTATTTAAGVASLLFGKAVLGAEGQLLVARATFAGVTLGLIGLGAAALAFGDKIQFTLGPIKNLHDAMIVLIGGLQQLITKFIGTGPALILVAGYFLAMRTGLYAIVGVFSVVIAALVRFDASWYTVAIAITATMVVLGAGAKLMGATGIVARGLILVFDGMVASLAILRGAWIGLTLAEIAADIAAAPLVIGFGLLAIALAAIGVAAAAFISELPGFSTFVDICGKIFGFLWDELIGWFDKWAKRINAIIDLIPGVRDFVNEVGRLFKLAWDKLVGWIEAVYDRIKKWASSAGEAAAKMIALDKITQQAADDINNAKKSTDGLADAAGKAASSFDKMAASASKAASAASAAYNPGAGGFNPGNGGYGSAPFQHANTVTTSPPDQAGGRYKMDENGYLYPTSSQSATGSAQDPLHPNTISGGFEIGIKVPGQPVYDPASRSYHRGPDSIAYGTATPIGQDPATAYNFVAQQTDAHIASANAALQKIQAFMQQTGYNTKLTADQLKLIMLETGLSRQAVTQVMQDGKAGFAQDKKIYDLQTQMAKDANKAANKAQAQAKTIADAQAAAAAVTQAVNQSISQLTLQALNAFGANTASQLPSGVTSLIQQIASIHGSLTGVTDPVQQAEMGRKIQVLTDSLNALTGAVNSNTAAQNPYTQYAQNVYGSLVGIQGAVSQGAAGGVSMALGSGGGAAAQVLSGGGGSSGHSSGHSGGSGITGGGHPGGGLPLYLGAFADGGSFNVRNSGRYSADLHAGERVEISPGGARGGTRQININMNVNGVKDADSFHRSRKQILATVYRDLMAVGEQT